ncbi:MAG: hypothetical protein KAJ25_10475 [Desulfobacula sp.]|nr:hypothetical protein [Desulfobacula sp.]
MCRISRQLILIILLLLFFIPANAAEPVKIGIILAKTGNAALDSSNGFEAARYAAKTINEKGGILKVNLFAG